MSEQQQLTREQWDTISAALRAPFDPADVDFRPQGRPQPGKSCQMVCYVDARAVMDRLDEAVGPGAWAFDYDPLVMDKEIRIAKGTLTIHGVAKSDAGEASEFAPSKGCVSDALKRCAALWGVGRYLYDVPSAWVTPDANGKIPPQEIAKLRAKLPRPGGTSARREEREDAPVAQAQQQQRQPTPIRPQPAAQARPAQPQAATPAAPEPETEEHIPEAPWNYLADVRFRTRCRHVGYTSVAQVQELVEQAHGGVRGITIETVDPGRVFAHLGAIEQEAARVAAQGGQR